MMDERRQGRATARAVSTAGMILIVAGSLIAVATPAASQHSRPGDSSGSPALLVGSSQTSIQALAQSFRNEREALLADLRPVLDVSTSDSELVLARVQSARHHIANFTARFTLLRDNPAFVPSFVLVNRCDEALQNLGRAVQGTQRTDHWIAYLSAQQRLPVADRDPNYAHPFVLDYNLKTAERNRSSAIKDKADAMVELKQAVDELAKVTRASRGPATRSLG